jgi:hypothetical protein
MRENAQKFLLIAAVLVVLGALVPQYLPLPLSNKNYWDHHGVLFLIFIAAFPRLTLLFSSVASGGILWWLAWIFAPRLLVAILATLSYGQQNWVLVALSWVIAIGGEGSEKYVVVKRARRQKTTQKGIHAGDVIDITPIRKD